MAFLGRRIAAIVTALILGGATTTACGGAHTAAPEQIVIAGGVDGGVYARYADALSHALTESLGRRVHVTVLSTAGSVDNLNRLASGRATFAICAADAVVDAENGRGGAAPASGYRAVARLYDDYLHLVVKASSPIHTLADLRGRRVAVGGPSSGTELVARRVLTDVDLADQVDARELGLSDAATALDRGGIDAFFWSGGLPTERVAQEAGTGDLRLVPLGDAVPGLRRMYGQVYRQGRIPAETYAGVDAVDTVAFPNLLVTTAGTADSVVRDVVTAMFAHPDVINGIPTGELLNRPEAIFTEPVPLHPAALGYFRDEKADIG